MRDPSNKSGRLQKSYCEAVKERGSQRAKPKEWPSESPSRPRISGDLFVPERKTQTAGHV